MVHVDTSFSVPTSCLCRRPSSRPDLFGTYADGPIKSRWAQGLAVGTLTFFCCDVFVKISKAHNLYPHKSCVSAQSSLHIIISHTAYR
jgi:hypothetical protein